MPWANENLTLLMGQEESRSTSTTGMNDGATAMVLMKKTEAKSRMLRPLGRI